MKSTEKARQRTADHNRDGTQLIN